MKKIIFILNNHLVSCPRAIKEMDFFLNNGFAISVFYVPVLQKLKHLDAEIISKYPTIQFKSISVNRFSYLNQRVWAKFNDFIFQNIGISLDDISLGSIFGHKLYAEIIKHKADLYIGHNYSVLPLINKLAKRAAAKCGFDAEDFHRHEVTDNPNAIEFKKAKYIEDKYLPHVDYITAASPLIAAEYKKLYPQLNPITINNVFTTPELTFQNQKSKIKNQKFDLFWFSQTVGKNRGLEDVLLALAKLNNPNISLHLLGNASHEIKVYLQSISPSTQIHFYEPIPPDDIFEFASQFDIGLALEKNVPYNRDICLTNKIFTYLSSGLAVIASETQAQKHFLYSYPTIGKSYPIGNIEALAQIINYYHHNKEALQNAKVESLNLAKNEMNWDKESEKLTEIISTL